ncbi:unnamed protein product [Staurois parvus]|uniref:Secreted protein n=1 Tax=Staurois parvus TaxID=386267 RepID=A0ABN9AHC7_9NEOB|nr:unnamed protein product [Staurois parvus]
MLNPSCPVPLVQCQCFFFFFSTDHCIGVTGDVRDTKSVPPPVSECPPQSRYKSLIATITNKNEKKNPSIHTAHL